MRMLTAALAAFVAAWSPAAAQAAIGPQQVEALDQQGSTEIIVRREPGLSAAERADVRADADVALERRSTLPDTEVVRADSGDLAEAVAELNRDPDVVYAEPVVVMSALSADSYYGSLWGLENTGQKLWLPDGSGYYLGGTPDADMDVPEAWTKATGAGVTVGIVDTGMLTTHPDLAAQVATNAGETGTDSLGRDKRSNGVDDDGNGYVDDWHGWDFVAEYPSIGVTEGDSTPGPDNDPQDNHGHGTHVAGTVAAQRDNNAGIAGVAPGAKVMPLRALGANGGGTNIAVAEAFDYAGKMGLRVVNASLGGPGLDQTQLTAIQAHPNTLYVIAAGNDGVDNDVSPHGPCALPAANILCVGASDQNDNRASFSNYGAASVDVFAPGTAILSTYPGPSYAYLNGTSMASPNTAGVAALTLSVRPGASALDVKSAIMASAEPKPDLVGKSVTGGRVNADRAVSGVLTGAPPANVTPPVINGAPRRGQVLTVSSAWDPAGTSYAYQWQRSADGVTWTTIGSASSYTLTTAERDTRVRVTITATNAYGQASATSDPIGPVVGDPPVSASAPTITGTTQRSYALTATAGSWDGQGNTFKYQWQRDDGAGWAAISGAIGAVYTLAKADEGARVRVLVTATNPDGSVDRASAATAAPVSPFPPANVDPPVITGTAQRSRTLSATRGNWTGPDNTYGYQWQRDFGEGYVDIAGARAPTYTLTVADVDATVRIVVTATNPDATIMEGSAPTAPVLAAGPVNQTPPTVTGTAQRGLTLTGSPGAWSGLGNATSYRWQSSTDGATWKDIPGATSSTYALAVGEVGSYVRLLVTVTNPDGTASAASAATAKVTAAPPVNTVRPTVTGTIQRASTLAAAPGTWAGNGNSFTYQWQRDAVDIPGATDSAYTLTAADVGAAVRVLVTATNPDGTATAASVATAAVPSAAPVNTVRPAVTGTAQRGLTLTGTAGTWSGVGNTVAYEWQSSADGSTWAKVGTGSTYAIGVADVGRYLRLMVTVTNPDGSASAASAATAKAAGAPPVNTISPTVTGTARRGSPLSGTAGLWNGIGNTYTYQWQRGTVDIPGATDPSYTPTTADVGATLRLVVTATNPEASASQASSATAAVLGDGPVNTVAPAIAGSAQRAATLSATPGTWTGNGTTIAYRWQRGTADISGATGQTYELTAADVGSTIRVVVTATNPDGSSSKASAPTATVKAAPPVNTSLPTVTGAALRGSTLTLSPGTWTGPAIAYAYQWQHDSGAGFTDIAGATGLTYALGVADVGTRLRVRVTAANTDASVTATSAASGAVRAGPPYTAAAPTISGTAQRTATLTSTRGEWGGIENDYAYQWQRRASGAGQFTDIAGATSAAYTLVSVDVGAQIRLKVTATNLDGTLSAYSGSTSAVATAPPRNEGLPSVSGPAKLGGSLTAAPGDWSPAGADFAYAWQRDGVDIAGATGSTYTLGAADVGRTVRVRVTASNVDGSATATSAATERVVAPPVNTVAPGAPAGTAKETSTLTALPGTWNTPDAGFSYTWVRCAAAATTITASCDEVATGATYTLAAADVGRRLGVRITARSSGGETTAASALTATIAQLTLANTTPPSISGTAYVGETLTGDAGRWTHPSADLAYEWQRCDADGTSHCARVGDGGSRYTASAADQDRAIVLVVAATSPGQGASARSAPLTIRARPAPRSLTAPSVTGTAVRGRTLTVGTGTWSNSPDRFRYQWQRCDGANCREIGGAAGSDYVLTRADEGFRIIVVVTASNSFDSGWATTAPTGPVAAAPPVNTGAPVVTGTVQQGATVTAGGLAWDATSDTLYSFAWLRCDTGGCQPIAGATGAQYTLLAADVDHTLVVVSTATNVDGSASARSAESAVATMAGPRWRTLPLIAGTGRVGATVTTTPGTWSGPVVTSDTTELMRCTNVCVPRSTDRTYTVAEGDLGAILRVRETASNVGGDTVVWSSRYVGPIVSAQAAAAVLTSAETPLRNARGATLALAKLSGATAKAAAAKAKGAKVTLRRAARVKGKLVAWACPAAITAGATPPPCSAKVALRKSATLRLPASAAGKVRVVVVRSGR
jgi:subtilisin family serine protease